LRKITFILIIAATLYQSISKLLILASYEINKEYIAKNLCENKDKSKMHCNGKCHLRKQLNKESKKDNTTLPHLKNKFENQFFSEKKLFDFNSILTKKLQPADLYSISDYNQHLLSIYHPPEA
jgi:hypothetical protein